MTLDYKQMPEITILPDVNGQIITPAFSREYGLKFNFEGNNDMGGFDMRAFGFKSDINPNGSFFFNSQTHQDYGNNAVSYRMAGGTGKMKINIDEKTKIRVGVREVNHNSKSAIKDQSCDVSISVKGRELLNTAGRYGDIHSVVRTFPVGEFPIEIKETCPFADEAIESTHGKLNNGSYSNVSWPKATYDWNLLSNEIFFELDDGGDVIKDGAAMETQKDANAIARGTPLPKYEADLLPLRERALDEDGNWNGEVVPAVVYHSVNETGKTPSSPRLIDFSKPVNVGTIAQKYRDHNLKPYGKEMTMLSLNTCQTRGHMRLHWVCLQT